MAPDITVGDVHPMCDTFTTASVEPGSDHPVVATCQMTH
jgi:hypothetical protein